MSVTFSMYNGMQASNAVPDKAGIALRISPAVRQPFFSACQRAVYALSSVEFSGVSMCSS